ncbi:endogenous retrovirus group PABLB member 1 Env polyprotein-like [Pleurodeles waltl]|uniref:endogenous retrovirus group PABLB member 1 Env polyprotein-like n=1 Tax=Pleurodeles waltl TaxID=8319 RepID=UPI0037099196
MESFQNGEHVERLSFKKRICETITRKRFLLLCIFMLFSILMFFIGYVLFCFNVILAPTTSSTPPPSTVSPHSFQLLPKHESARRLEFINNSFIQLLHQHQLVINTTNCWVCGLMPHTADKGIPYLILPFSHNGSVWAFRTIFIYAHYPLCFAEDNPKKNALVKGIIDMMKDNIFYETIPRDETIAYIGWNMTGYEATMSEKQQAKIYSLIWVVPHQGHLCLQGTGKNPRAQLGESVCTETYVFASQTSPLLLAAKGTYFICHDRAFTWLPPDFSGTCFVSLLLPPTYTAAADYHKTRIVRGVFSEEDTAGQEFGDFVKGFLPFWGQIGNSRSIRQLIRVVESTVAETAGALGNLTAELQSDRLMTLQNRVALDVILADQGGVCTLIQSSCCVFVPDNAPTVYQAISKLHRISESIHLDRGDWSLMGWFWELISAWGWKILMVIGMILAILFLFCLCVQCAPAICGLCVTSCIRKPAPRDKLNTMMMLQQHLNDFRNIDLDSD